MTAVVLTLTGIGSVGNLVAYPSDEAAPGVSNLQLVNGQTVTNTAIVRVSGAVSAGGSAGSITVRNAAGSTRVLVDLQGYYVVGTGSAGGSGYMPLQPSRLLDTRTGQGAAAGAGRVPGNSSVVVQATGAATGIPPTASAVTVNVAALHPTTVGYVVAYAYQPGAAPGAGLPPTATVNLQPGQDVDNAAEVPLGGDGRFQVYAANSATDLVVDITGYYLGSAQGGSTFVPLPGTRILNTLNAAPLAGNTAAPVRFTANAGGDGVPSADVSAVALDVTVLNNTGAGNLRVYPSDAPAVPIIASVNYHVPAAAVTNLVLTRLDGNGQASIYSEQSSNSDHGDVVIDVVGYYTAAVPDPPGNVRAIAGDTRATATWTPGNSFGRPVTGYTVYARDAATFALVSSVNAPATACTTSCTATITGLQGGQSIVLTVVETTGAPATSAESAPSNIVDPTGPPTAVTNVIVAAGDGTGDATWTAPQYSNPAPTGYLIGVLNDDGSAASPTPTVTVSGTTAHVTGLQDGVVYLITVAAQNGDRPVGTGPTTTSLPFFPA